MKSIHDKTTLPASLLAWLILLVAFLATGVVLADGDDGDGEEVHVVERHKIALKLDGDLAGDMEVIEIEDLEIGESRQFFTDEGKEIVVTRNDDGIDITVDGEELHLPKTIHVESVTDKMRGDDTKIVIRSQSHDSHGSVWISDGDDADKHVVIHRLGDDGGSGFQWVSGDDAEIHDLHDLRLGGSPSKFLDEKGVLDGLDESERQAILDALDEYESERGHPRALFISKDLHEDHDRDED